MDYPRSIRFGDFVLNRTRGCLQDSSGTERFLRPKSYRVLEVLAERRGQLVSKDDLVQATWPDVFVSDDSLAQCVSDTLRRDQSSQPQPDPCGVALQPQPDYRALREASAAMENSILDLSHIRRAQP
ncbi:MAG: hypothetical protein EOS10_17680 [Mesorhizobium sp.]|uniref:winged helix-turn-helix domain-containing protein n=1 Tax=Mesorhizobium sp. TaxID=1871066 RepID=UPI000FE8B80D|nr:MAG: hypothetical protein EOS10_17680 [Mesorhizobium sp.]